LDGFLEYCFRYETEFQRQGLPNPRIREEEFGKKSRIGIPDATKGFAESQKAGDSANYFKDYHEKEGLKFSGF
jgi:hypothetical protein